MTQAVALAQQASTGVSQGFKNRIINGAMVIDQRNAGASVTINSDVFTLDRWRTYQSQTGKFSVQQNAGSVTPPAGFNYYLGATSLSAYSVGAGDYFMLEQTVEGFNFADLNFGTANAKTFTFSFWVRSSLTGTFGGGFTNEAYNRTFPFTYTISSANTWEQKSVTVVGDTTGSWTGATNAIGIRLRLVLGCGSSRLSSTVNQWVAGGFDGPTGATSVVGTNGATLYITGVQLEVGSTATSFDTRSIGTELQLCQRYYQKSYNQDVAAGTSANDGGIHVLSWGDGNASGISWQTTMRANPTVVFYPTNSTLAGYVNSGGTDRVATASAPSQRGYNFIAVTAGAVSTYTRFQYTANAEL